MSKYNPRAFPLAGHEFGEYDHEPGMTLRDYFAAKAMQGWLASYGPDAAHPAAASKHEEQVAAYSYALADAMLREREK